MAETEPLPGKGGKEENKRKQRSEKKAEKGEE